MWKLAILTDAKCSFLCNLTVTSSCSFESIWAILIGIFSKKALASSFCSSVTPAITSNFFSGFPPMTPMATEAFNPFIPFVLGTMTLLTFLIILPLAKISTLSGIPPNTSLAFAAAYARHIGSVQPIAGTNSSFKMLMYIS